MFEPVVVIKGEQRLLRRLKEVAKGFKERSEVAVYNTMKGAPRIAAKHVQKEIGNAATQTAIMQKIEKRKIKQGTHALIMYKTDRIQLSKFVANQTRQGVTYKMRGQRHLVPSAFMGNYKRKSRPPRLKGGVWKRMANHRTAPIAQLFGPSPWGVLNPRMARQPLYDQVQKALMDRFAKQLQKEINYQVSKLNN